MLYWALVFFLIGVVAAVFGFGGIATTAATVAQILFIVFLALFVGFLVSGLIRLGRGRPPPI